MTRNEAYDEAQVALGAIVEALQVPRNRMGKLCPTAASSYVIGQLAMKYKVGGSEDVAEQCEKVASAVIRLMQEAREPR